MKFREFLEKIEADSGFDLADYQVVFMHDGFIFYPNIQIEINNVTKEVFVS